MPDLCWLISEFWLPSLELNGQLVDAAQFERGVSLTVQLLNPILPSTDNIELGAAQRRKETQL